MDQPLFLWQLGKHKTSAQSHFSCKNKHIDIQHHCIRENVVGDVEVQYNSTHIQQVDNLKKPLSWIRFQAMREMVKIIFGEEIGRCIHEIKKSTIFWDRSLGCNAKCKHIQVVKGAMSNNDEHQN